MTDVVQCGTCGSAFDPADLTQVLYHHKHEPVPGLGIRGVRVDAMYRDAGAKCVGVVTCGTCNTVRTVSKEQAAEYLRTGWPRCCGQTMILATDPGASR